MRDAIVFGGAEVLDFQEVRANILRLPDVSLRVEQAQEIWDRVGGASFNFYQFLSSENFVFFNNVGVKCLAASIVQLGLYDRYLRKFPTPAVLIGDTENDSPLMVAAGHLTLEGLIKNSLASGQSRPVSPVRLADELQLIGQKLPNYRVVEAGAGAASGVFFDRGMAVQHAIANHEVTRLVHVGPGASKLVADAERMNVLDNVEIVDSVDMDPMLSWFWSAVQHGSGELKAAQ